MLRFPLISRDVSRSSDVEEDPQGTCLWCGKNTSQGYVAVEGNAVSMNWETQIGETNESVNLVLELNWRSFGDSTGDVAGDGLSVLMVDMAEGGFFSLKCCSFECARSLLLAWVDETERELRVLSRGRGRGAPSPEVPPE